MLKKEIGLRIRNIRINMNLSGRELAEKLGISAQYLSAIEHGKGALSLDRLEQLCKLSHSSADYILFGKGPVFPSQLSDTFSDYTQEEIELGCAALEKMALLLKHIS